MIRTARMGLLVVLLAALTATACNRRPAPFDPEDRSPRADRDAPFDPPNSYPGWAYDAPAYKRPAAALSPAPRAKQGDPLHYFTNKKLVMIRQPVGYEPEEIPRVAIWWTDNNGFRWHKGGYFGRRQKFFPFEVEEDGDYGIRFVGPGQAPAVHTPAYPERVYHVDTQAPEVEISIEPERSWYEVGQKITISWRVDDYHLTASPATLKMLMDFTADEPKVIELQRELAHEGSVTFEIPRDALDQEIRFGVDAVDRSGNLGLAHSYALQVVEQSVADASEQEDEAADAGGFMPIDASGESEVSTEPPVPLDVADAGEETNLPPLPVPQTGRDDPTAARLAEEAGPPRGDAPADAPADARPDDAGTPRAIAPAEGSAAVPFSTSLARRPTNGNRLIWNEPEPTSFPSGNSWDEHRSSGTLFDIEEAMPADLPNDAMSGPSDADPPPHEQTSDADPPRQAPTLDAGAARPPTPAFGDGAASSGVPPQVRAAEDGDGNGDRDAAWTGSPALVRSAMSVVDPTYGNGLLVPLPATVEAEPPPGALVTAHPWRILGKLWSSPLRTVWALPTARFGYELNRMFAGRVLPDHPPWRPVAEPGAVRRAIAGLPADAVEVDPARLP